MLRQVFVLVTVHQVWRSCSWRLFR